MGCCQGREEISVSSHTVQRRHRFPGPDDDWSDQDSLVFLEKYYLEHPEEKKQTPEDLQAYLEWCFNLKRWREVTQMITDDSEIPNCRVYISWAEKPKTVGSLALVYLCLASQKYPDTIAAQIEPYLPVVVNIIRVGSEDLKENATLLLYYFLDQAGPLSVSKLLKLNIFNILVRCMLCEKPDLRYLTAALCDKIYTGRKEAQDSFLNVNGGNKLMQLLVWNSDSEGLLYEYLGFVIDLILDTRDQPRPDVVEKLHDCMAWEIIKNIDTSSKSVELIDQLDFLISLLACQDTPSLN